MRRKFITFLFHLDKAVVLATLFLCGCLAEETKTPVVGAQTTNAWFSGVKTVQNLGGSPSSIKISWDPPLQSIQGYNIYAVDQNSATGAWMLVDSVSPSTTSYVHSGLISGLLYTYKVEAIDMTGSEDKNKIQKSTVAFEGIYDVLVTGKTTATAQLGSTNGSFDQIRIYAQPKFGNQPKVLVGLASGVSTSINLTGLRSGVTYSFSAQAFMSFLGGEDGNQVTVTKQTPSVSFGSGEISDTNYTYRGFMNVMSYGKAPGAPDDTVVPERSPKTRQIRLTWLPFQNSTATTTYRLIRAPAGVTMDSTVTNACTTASTGSCVVCEVIGVNSLSCLDTAIPDFDPKTQTVKFEYTVTQVLKDVSNTSYAEELPLVNTNDYKTSVQVPPDNMVLVHRDAANFEMCQTLGRTSDPRKKQRCPYTGLGNVPINSGPNRPSLNLDPAYYDFGYNLFVDRWPLACNWTKASNGGKCGSTSTPGNPTSGDCIGIGGQTDAFGADANFANKGKIGDVFLFMARASAEITGGWWQGYNCYIKTASGWQTTNSLTLTNAEKLSMLTNDPSSGGGHRPPALGFGPDTGWSICQASQNAYGNKRLIRKREYVVSNTISRMAGEPFAVTSRNARNRLWTGTDGFTGAYRQCLRVTSSTSQIPTLTSVSAPDDLGSTLMTAGNWRAQLMSGGSTYGNYNYLFIGNPYTTGCISRFGVNDIAGMYNLGSDRVIKQGSSVPGDYLSVASLYDNGANDTPGMHWDGIRGTSYTSNVFVSIATGDTATPPFNYFNPTLGIPIVTRSSSAEDIMTVRDYAATGNDDGEGFTILGTAGGPNATMNLVLGAGSSAASPRFNYSYISNATNQGGPQGLRCVEEAE